MPGGGMMIGVLAASGASVPTPAYIVTDGVNEEVRLGTLGGTVGSSCTFAFWAYRADWSTIASTHRFWGAVTNSGCPARMYVGSGSVFFEVSTSGSGGQRYSEPDAAVDGLAAGWHHFAWTYTSGDGQVRAYIDGVLLTAGSNSGFSGISNRTAIMTVGSNNGLFDPVSFRAPGVANATALSGVQIAALYALGNTGNPTATLLGYAAESQCWPVVTTDDVTVANGIAEGSGGTGATGVNLEAGDLVSLGS